MVPLCWNCYDNHDTIECETLKKLQLPATFLIDNFDVVTPLRVLLLLYRYAEQNVHSTVAPDLKTQIDELLSMESHCVERQGTWIWNQHAKNVIEPMREIDIDGKFAGVQAPWNLTDDFLQKICGILDVNTFEVRTQYFEVMFKCFSIMFFSLLHVGCCFTICCYPKYVDSSLFLLLLKHTHTSFTGISRAWPVHKRSTFGTWLHWKYTHNGWQR